MAELMEAYIGSPEGLPGVEPDSQTEFIEQYFRAGAPELRHLFLLGYASLMVLTPLLRGKTFSRLNVRERQDLLNRLCASRNPLLRGIAVILGLPILMSYYRREDVHIPLGFDPKALKEEADLRVVSRDRDLPPKGEERP